MQDEILLYLKRPRTPTFLANASIPNAQVRHLSFFSPQRNTSAQKYMPARIGGRRCEIETSSHISTFCVATMNANRQEASEFDSDPHGPDRGEGDEGDSEGNENDMIVHRKGDNKSYNGDLLPFDICVVTPPPKYLGRFRLDPRTHNGDIIEYDGIHFLVKRVRMQYKYKGGKHRMVRKTIEVKSLARKALESYLEKTFEES